MGMTAEQRHPDLLVNWRVLVGYGNVCDNVFEAAGGTYRGLSVRAYDRDKKQWLSWWLDGRNPSFAPLVRGSFKDGVGTFIGDDVFNGKPIKVRSQWSRMTPSSTHWEQASSQDGGATWETNWVSDMERKA